MQLKCRFRVVFRRFMSFYVESDTKHVSILSTRYSILSMQPPRQYPHLGSNGRLFNFAFISPQSLL